MAKAKSAKSPAPSGEVLTTVPVQMLIANRDQLGADVFPLQTGEAFASIPVGDVRPGSQITWYYSGPAGATMTLSLNRVPNSGGHIHAGGPTGSLSRTSIILGTKYPQNEPVVFTAPDAAGTIEITGVASKGGNTTGQNRVHIPGFTALTGGVGLTLTGGMPEHPGNHFGLPALVQKIQQLGAQFHAKFGKNLFVNDMSLHDGGLYDFHSTWAPPHATHREGRTVDVNSTSMSSEEKAFFKVTATGLGFRVALESTPPHWHLTM
ncbi:hypothetical protein [Caballeronia sp. DA-9]|uniref:hypothetical protein n=1 Tax=Caballeronia sp. DA-9 TaxID=3436237 RepID=UPI003F671C0D